MNLFQPRKTHFEKLSTLVASPDKLADTHVDTEVPEEIIQWLSRLKLLYGVPFNYLVPDEKMLPSESIRFFQLDLNWIYCLIEGAYSIGRSTTADLAHDAVFLQKLHAESTQVSKQVRAPRAEGGTTIEHVTGFLLRSAVVAGWPGLAVNAYDENNNELTTILRMERLSASVLLFMVEGIIHHVDIHEPAEGLHFGVDLSDGKSLRYVTVPQNAPPNTLPGTQIECAMARVPVPFRCSGRVIKIDQLAQNIQKVLESAHANNNPKTGEANPFTAAEFALEMVEGVQEVRFENKPPEVASTDFDRTS